MAYITPKRWILELVTSQPLTESVPRLATVSVAVFSNVNWRLGPWSPQAARSTAAVSAAELRARLTDTLVAGGRTNGM
jgi:hypothetical protein